jgi:murein DD-endopeptidase MepM/ murein hydrolase activator NlpD
MKVVLKQFPVVIPPGFEPLELCYRGKKFCPGQDAPEYKPRWGGGFHAPRGPSKTPHRAVDIMAAIGADVLAVDDGVVQERWKYKGDVRPGAGLSPKGGYYVRIRHSWGVSYYAHLHGAPLVQPGDRVSAGQKLGVVGRSGNAKPGCPHLHLSIQVGPRLVDPVPLLLPLYQAGQWKGK